MRRDIYYIVLAVAVVVIFASFTLAFHLRYYSATVPSLIFAAAPIWIDIKWRGKRGELSAPMTADEVRGVRGFLAQADRVSKYLAIAFIVSAVLLLGIFIWVVHGIIDGTIELPD